MITDVAKSKPIILQQATVATPIPSASQPVNLVPPPSRSRDIFAPFTLPANEQCTHLTEENEPVSFQQATATKVKTSLLQQATAASPPQSAPHATPSVPEWMGPISTHQVPSSVSAGNQHFRFSATTDTQSTSLSSGVLRENPPGCGCSAVHNVSVFCPRNEESFANATYKFVQGWLNFRVKRFVLNYFLFVYFEKSSLDHFMLHHQPNRSHFPFPVDVVCKQVHFLQIM